MASTTAPPKIDMNDPNVRRLVYNMYRGMLGTYNDKANDFVDSVPRSNVTEDAGIYRQLEAMIKQSSDGRGGPPPPPPPAPPGQLPGRRIQTEVPIPERGNEPPAAIQNAMMTKDKKPFTYTPGGLDLSEIKSPRMARRVNRNAHADEIHGEHAPSHANAPQTHLSPAAVAAMQPQMPTQVFPSGPPPPPPPPSFPPPPLPPSCLSPTPQAPPQPPSKNQTLPRIRGFDPNEILTRGSRLQPRSEQDSAPLSVQNPSPVQPQQIQRESPRSQLGSIYIPPVQSYSQDNNTPSSASSQGYIVTSPPSTASTPASPGPEPRKGPTPWVPSQVNQQPTRPPWMDQRNQQQTTPPPPAQNRIEARSPQLQQGGARIIPIQIEGREQQLPPQQSPGPYRQQQQVYEQQPQRPPSAGSARVIPIQIEGAAPPPPLAPSPQQNRPQYQQKYVPVTPSSPTPYIPPSAESNQSAPQWAPVQPRMAQKPQDSSDGRPQFPQQQRFPQDGSYQDYGAYNTAGVPLSQLRKMQLSDEDKALMEKLKTQADSYQNSDDHSEAEKNPLYKGSYIPSRAFKILEESVDDEQYLHRETDPRYRGAAIPSRAFRMLQTMTDTAGEVPQVQRGPSRGPPSRPQSATAFRQDGGGQYVPPSEQQVPEPRKYTGGSIPSRSFRMLQAMTGQDAPVRGSSSPNSPSGQETPVAQWCPSSGPSPMDPYWGYYPPDPYMFYNYYSDLNAAYGYPPPPPPPHQNYPPPPPPPHFIAPRYSNYMSDSEEGGYSSTDELGQYYANYRRNMGYPSYNVEQGQYPVREVQKAKETVKPKEVPKPKQEEPKKIEIREEVIDSSDESVSSSEEEEETDTDDTEIEEKEVVKKLKKSSHKLHKEGSSKAVKSVSDVKLFTSESTATVTNDEWEDCDSKVGEDDGEELEEDEEVEEEEEEEEVEETSEEEEEADEEDGDEDHLPLPIEEQIPHQLSIIYEESEISDLESIRRGKSLCSELTSVTSETESTATLDRVVEDDEIDESDEEGLESESSVTVRLPLQLKFSQGSTADVTTLIIGDSEVKKAITPINSESSHKECDSIYEDTEGFDDVDKLSIKGDNFEDHEEEKFEDVQEEIKVDEDEEEDADVSVTFSLRTRSTSVAPEEKVKVTNKAENDEKVDTEVTVSLCLPKKGKGSETVKTDQKKEAKMESFSSWMDKVNEKDWAVETKKTDGKRELDGDEDNVIGEKEEVRGVDVGGSYEKNAGKLEDMISSILDNTQEAIKCERKERTLKKKDSKDSVEESEEDDSGVTDMSNKMQNSETDGDNELEDFSELCKMTQFQRASTHSRLFKLLQDECEKSDTEDEGDDEKSENEQISSPVHLDEQESISALKEKMTLPLAKSATEVGSQSSSSGVTSPSSPTVRDRLVKELVQSLLNKKKGKKFRKLPLAKLHAAALRILQEDMDPYDTSSASASGDDGFLSSPVNPKPHSQEQPPPVPVEPAPENIYGQNYYDYLEYYNTWGHPGYYGHPEYDIMPPRAYQYMNHPGAYSPGFKPKCPRIPPPGLPYMPPSSKDQPPMPQYRMYEDSPEMPLTFADKRDRVAKVLEKAANT